MYALTLPTLVSSMISPFLVGCWSLFYLKLSWSEYLYVSLASNIFCSASGYNWTVLLCWSQACKWDNWDYHRRACPKSKTGCHFFLMLYARWLASSYLFFSSFWLVRKKLNTTHGGVCMCILFITNLGCCYSLLGFQCHIHCWKSEVNAEAHGCLISRPRDKSL